MLTSQFSLIFILLPAVVALVNVVLPVILRKLLSFFSSIFLLYLVINALFLSNWMEQVGFGTWRMLDTTVFAVDQMSIFALGFIQLLSFIILIYALKGVKPDIQKPFFALFPLSVAACNGVVLSEHGISLLIFWGLSGMTLFLYALLGHSENALQTAKKTVLIIGGSDAVLIMGFAVMVAMKPEAGWALSQFQIPVTSGLAWLAFILVLIAAFAKAGGFPLHTWLPDYTRDAPVESAALLPASLDKLLGIYLLARMVTTLFTVQLVLNLILITLGAITVITAVMMAMIQHNGRRLLGYHAVSQVGYMIIGVGSGNPIAFAGGLFHLVNNTIYKSNLFLTLGSVEKQTGTNDLDDLGGLGRNMPITFVMALIGALSISGIPPFNGFFSKWMIYQGVLDMARTATAGQQIWLLVCLTLAVFGSALTLASFMKFMHAIYLGKRPEKHNDVKETSFNQWLSTGILAALCIVFGLFALAVPLRQLIYPATTASGLALPEFVGLYQPLTLFLLFAIIFLIGMLTFALTKNIRFDNIYLGGMSAWERFRVSGTAFYNEIRSMRPLKGIYSAAEKKVFDVYDVSSKGSAGLAKVLQQAHPGLLSLYVFFIVLGVVIFLAVL